MVDTVLIACPRCATKLQPLRSCTEPSLYQDTQQHVHNREGSKKNEEQHQNGHHPTLLQVQVFEIFLGLTDFSPCGEKETWNA